MKGSEPTKHILSYFSQSYKHPKQHDCSLETRNESFLTLVVSTNLGKNGVCLTHIFPKQDRLGVYIRSRLFNQPPPNVPMVDKPLIRPYFWGGVPFGGGVGWTALIRHKWAALGKNAAKTLHIVEGQDGPGMKMRLRGPEHRKRKQYGSN